MTSSAVAVDLVAAMRAGGLCLAVAESLTGGSLCSAVVAVPGASTVLRGGVTAYDTRVKTTVLGVEPALVAEHGVVSVPVAVAMARGAATLLGADVGVATTGVAGPGPSDGVPAGTVALAVVARRRVRVRRVLLAGSRALVRDAAVDLALALALTAVADGCVGASRTGTIGGNIAGA
ncbi:CinA family protein [Litorihabitans aurantiacus]|uniref:CinA C-terminal domain-containing protein n=1 Tax=Litorihabitans aurantiacus TaxID=1930061 RepID=A0AA38CP75_9MICO|nr:nicotinamide-nucleotide amidohydrolase family protein [Litorihabitans aurantiacus]GMA31763.1 hypothetical protein GCM10025875_17550 [Litorihabitans aurantiacus]